VWNGILNKDKLIKHIAELIIENDENIIFALKTHDREWLEKIIKEYVCDDCLNKEKLCPHGYEDWDDCPDCRH